MIEFKKHFNLGDKIQVISLNRLKKTEYVSQIAEIYDDYIEIFNPIYKNSLVYFSYDEDLKIIILKSEAIFEFQSKVIGKRHGKIPIVRLKATSVLSKIQRRDYYRLKTTKAIRFKKIYPDDIFSDISHYYDGILLDISGGGMLFCSKYEMNKGDSLEVELFLNDDKKIVLYGNIIRKNFNIQKSFLYEYGVKFENLDLSDKDLLIRFIFNEQRKLLKKGLM